MMETESISKKQRADSQPGRDRLSKLPLEIIHAILALVPIREAIRTSILSRQWRYTWTSLPCLVFKQDCISVEDIDERMKNFITHVLFLHKGPVHKVELSVPFKWNSQNIGAWLLCLSRKDVRELIIDTAHSQSSIYSCKKLTKLELFNCELDPPPTTFKAFLFLRCLSLRNVCLSTDGVERLVANCPLLEELTLHYCKLEELRITAPNLKYLGMGIESCHHTLVFHRLKVISLIGVDDDDIKYISVVARLILGAPNLEMLILWHFHCASKVRHLPFSDFGCAPDFKLEKLSFVTMMRITGLPPQMALIRFLLERSPVLETMFLVASSSTEKQKVSAELDECKRASPNVKLTFLES